ncbi:MAG: cell division protein CrgA [Acidimicrobiales bacterium]
MAGKTRPRRAPVGKPEPDTGPATLSTRDAKTSKDSSAGKDSRAGKGPKAAKARRLLGRSRGARNGRTTPSAKDRARTNGRYTAPIPRSVKRSPRWYPWVLLGLLLVGALCVILNYIQVLPASPTNWYVVGGLAAILAAALMATSYR